MFKYLVCLVSNHRYKVTRTIDGGVYVFCKRCGRRIVFDD